MLASASTISLPSGFELPVLSYGTFGLREPRSATALAIQLGYRGIDTASGYGNAAAIGAAVREADIPRDQLFVTSKISNSLANSDGSDTDWDRAIATHLDEIGLAYLDLLLIHAPFAVPRERLRLWHAMERAVDQGRVRSIGVSNLCVAPRRPC